MLIKEQVRKGRKPRRENGNARDDSLWNVRGVDETTKQRVTALTRALGTPTAGVIDLAVKRLFQDYQSENQDEERKRLTLSPTAKVYASLLEPDSALSTDPALLKLEKRLQERRRARDELMGRKSTEATPEAAESRGG